MIETLLVVSLASWLGTMAPARNANAEALPSSSMVQAPTNDDGTPRQDVEKNPRLYLQLIAGMQAKGLYFASMAHLDAFDRYWQGNPRAALLRADALRETGYPDKASAIYQTLLHGDEAARAYHGLGIIAGRRNDRKAAIGALASANRLDPTNTPILNDLGYLQLLDGQRDDARINLHKAAELDPKDERAGANLALLYLLEDKRERAVGIMQWYKMPEANRKQIYSKADELAVAAQAASGRQPDLGSAESTAGPEKQ